MAFRSGRAWAAAAVLAAASLARAEDKDGWTTVFDGKTLDGWRTTGAVWKVEDGAIVGHAEKDLKAGFCLTKRNYGDVEVELEFKIDWGFDSGLFLRTTDEGKAYQVTIDYRKDGYVGAIYVGGLPKREGQKGPYLQEPKAEFNLKNGESPADSKLLKKDGWNRLYAKIEGKAPHIVVKLNGETIIDVTDAAARHMAEGPIGLQVHGGHASEMEAKVRYRNIRVRPIGAAAAAGPKSFTLAVSGMT